MKELFSANPFGPGFTDFQPKMGTKTGKYKNKKQNIKPNLLQSKLFELKSILVQIKSCQGQQTGLCSTHHHICSHIPDPKIAAFSAGCERPYGVQIQCISPGQREDTCHRNIWANRVLMRWEVTAAGIHGGAHWS